MKLLFSPIAVRGCENFKSVDQPVGQARLPIYKSQSNHRCCECKLPLAFRSADGVLIVRMNFDREIGSSELIFVALARAEDRVSRLDERVAACGFCEGWRTRADVRAVVSGMASAGQLVHPEDLLLHDLGADVRVPDAGVLRARALLQARRKALRGGPELLSWQGIAWLCGLTKQPPPPGLRPSAEVSALQSPDVSLFERMTAFFDALSKGDSNAPRAGVEDCLAVIDLPGVPPLLQSAAFLEAWRVADPLPSQRLIAMVAAELLLKTSGRFAAGLLPVEVGLRRRAIPSRLAWEPLADRLSFWLGLMEAAAEIELEEIVRLRHQKNQIERKAAGGRRDSRTLDLARLAVETPVLTTEFVAKSLKVTPQASLQLIRRLDGVLFEITGRSRFRVWRL